MWMIAFDEIFIDKTKYGVKVQTSEYGTKDKLKSLDIQTVRMDYLRKFQ